MEALLGDPFAWIEDCQTGDLIFFHGNRVTSLVIEMSGGIPWSHVGMVVRSPSSGHLCLWEATSHPTSAACISIIPSLTPPAALPLPTSRAGHTGRNDAYSEAEGYSAHDARDAHAEDGSGDEDGVGTWIMGTGPTGGGTRLVDLRTKLHEETLCAHMAIQGATRHSVMERRIYQFVQEHLGLPYESDPVALFNSWWDLWDSSALLSLCGLGENGEPDGKYFCSALMVDTLRHIHVMDAAHGPGAQRDQSAREWTVRDVLDLHLQPYPGGQSPLLTTSYAAPRTYRLKPE